MGEVAMGEVKRYDIYRDERDRSYLKETDAGRFVEHSDYTALEARSEALENERDALAKKLAAAEEEAENLGLAADSYWKKMNASEAEVARLKSALSESDVAVKRLSAACAAKDAALLAFDADQCPHDMALEMREAALSTDAGKDWIDATGAVKAKVLRQTAFGNAWLEWTPMPADWAGASVLIIPKPKE